MRNASLVTLLSFSLLPALPSMAGQFTAPPIMLASEYQESIELNQYLMSEKFDGVRAYWNGKQLLTRSGNQIPAPVWFTQGFPQIALDGELWLGRRQFDELSKLVRANAIDDPLWQKVRFMVFDLPTIVAPFEMRYSQLNTLLKQLHCPWLELVTQSPISSEQALQEKLHQLVTEGGEGLMLRLRHGLYEPKRSHQLLKLKLWQDDEAMVIAHQQGQGQFEGMMGALWVVNSEGIQFKIGTGFSLEQRKSPPEIGSRVSYKFHGTTPTGKPRFASFMRLKNDE